MKKTEEELFMSSYIKNTFLLQSFNKPSLLVSQYLL